MHFNYDNSFRYKNFIYAKFVLQIEVYSYLEFLGVI
jgi:hypothetical protein